MIKGLTYENMLEALNTLRLARKESSQAFNRASYGNKVQPLFDILDKEEIEDRLMTYKAWCD